MTDLEKKVYEVVKNECWLEYSADVNTIADVTGLSKSVIKGVVGSLTKKGMVECDHEDRNGSMMYDIFAIVDGKIWSYAAENDMEYI